MEKRNFGYLPSPPDYRDFRYGNMVPLKVDSLPDKFLLEKTLIRDQGQWGSCVGHAAASLKISQEKFDNPQVNLDFSPLFIYSLCKQRDGIPEEEGTYIRTAMDVLIKDGCCLEKDMPYSLLKDHSKMPSPSEQAMESALPFKVKSYARADTVDEIKCAIAKEGAVVAGIFVCSNFVEDTTKEGGFIPLPSRFMLGGHAVKLDGYDDNLTYTYTQGERKGQTLKGFFRLCNSWGESWGDEGYGWLPYDFLTYRLEDMTEFLFFWEGWSCVDMLIPYTPEDGNERVIELWVDKSVAYVNGVKYDLDQPVVLNPQTGRTLVPLRFISEHLGAFVHYNGSDKKITITLK